MSVNPIKNDNWQKLFKEQKAFNDDKEEQRNLIDGYFFIYDCIENNILYINSAFTTLTGHDDKTFTIDKLIEIIHPDDVEYFFKCEEIDLKFTNTLSFNEHFKYIISYTYRIKNAQGEYITIQQQCQAIDVNNQGNLCKTLVLHKRIEDYDKRPANDHKIFDKAKNIYIDADNCYNLTKRELEILQLIKEGMSSLDISNHLNVSKHTIDTHRKNILAKTSSANFIDLIRKLTFNDTL